VNQTGTVLLVIFLVVAIVFLVLAIVYIATRVL
jgi:hypothetical protein